MSGTALVFGATGFVGRQVVAQLAARGQKVVAHVRPDSAQLETWQKRFAEQGAQTDSTAWTLEALTARLRELRPKVIYLCLGTTARRARAEQVGGNPYERVDYGLTKLAVDAAAAALAGQADGVRLVYLSSIGAAPNARSSYLAWRGKAEDAVRASGLPWVIARPSIITESAVATRDDRRLGERISAHVGDAGLALLALLGARRLRARYRSTTPEILAAALLRLADEAPAGHIASGDELR